MNVGKHEDSIDSYLHDRSEAIKAAMGALNPSSDEYYALSLEERRIARLRVGSSKSSHDTLRAALDDARDALNEIEDAIG